VPRRSDVACLRRRVGPSRAVIGLSLQRSTCNRDLVGRPVVPTLDPDTAVDGMDRNVPIGSGVGHRRGMGEVVINEPGHRLLEADISRRSQKLDVMVAELDGSITITVSRVQVAAASAAIRLSPIHARSRSEVKSYRPHRGHNRHRFATSPATSTQHAVLFAAHSRRVPRHDRATSSRAVVRCGRWQRSAARYGFSGAPHSSLDNERSATS
jgi:hypothetical protein